MQRSLIDLETSELLEFLACWSAKAWRVRGRGGISVSFSSAAVGAHLYTPIMSRRHLFWSRQSGLSVLVDSPFPESPIDHTGEPCRIADRIVVM